MSFSIKELLHQAEGMLPETDLPRLEMRLFIGFVLNISPSEVMLTWDRSLTEDQLERLRALCQRRNAYEPLAKIMGQKSFWKHDFFTSPSTLDPRPDSEVMIEALMAEVSSMERILDLGTGTGCLILSALHQFPQSFGLAVDRSWEALCVAKKNAESLAMDSRVAFLQGSWTEALAEASQSFDVILSNPPYIPSGDIAELDPSVRLYDPLSALDGGEDGLDPYRLFSKTLPGLLRPGGWLFVEMGYNQSEAVAQIFREAECPEAPWIFQEKQYLDIQGYCRVLGWQKHPLHCV